MVVVSLHLLFIMHSCQSCGKSFSRNDSLRRHQRQYCSVIMPRRRSQNRIDSKQTVVKSNNLIDYSSLDFIQILTFMMNEQRYRWKKILKSLRMHYYQQKSLILRLVKKLIPLTMTKHAVLLSDVLSLNV